MLGEYLGTGHFREATFKNWESECLKMGLYVFLTAFLVQRGSAESKKPEDEGDNPQDDDPREKADRMRRGRFAGAGSGSSCTRTRCRCSS